MLLHKLKINILFCVLSLSELFSESLLMQVNDGDKETKFSLPRTKRISKASLTTREDPTPEEEVASELHYNPCKQPLLVKPDFRAPGRSVTEITQSETGKWVKFNLQDLITDNGTECYEYIWSIKFREDRDSKQSGCDFYKLQQSFKNDDWSNHTYSPGPAALGGRDTVTGEFPHMAAIGWKTTIGTWAFKCGGSLISPNFVLTAAHCTRASSLDTTIADVVPKIVRLGDKNIIGLRHRSIFLGEVYDAPQTSHSEVIDPNDVNISRIIIHPNYDAPKKYFDIALIELGSDVEFNLLIQPACLFTKSDTSTLGSKATLTGWGVVDIGSRKTSPELQAADVDIVDNQQCDKLLRPMCNRNWCGIQDHQICAGKMAGGVDACQGDSGGPLQVEISLPRSTPARMHYIIGVTSFGFKCGLANTPGVYTRVSSFIDWIEGIVWK